MHYNEWFLLFTLIDINMLNKIFETSLLFLRLHLSIVISLRAVYSRYGDRAHSKPVPQQGFAHWQGDTHFFGFKEFDPPGVVGIYTSECSFVPLKYSHFLGDHVVWG